MALTLPRLAATCHSGFAVFAMTSPRFSAPVYPASAWALFSFPCSNAWVCAMSATFAAVPVSVCTRPEPASTPMCAFIPKCHWLPFLVWCISGSRSRRAFLVELGAAFDRRVDDRALLHQQLALGEQRAHFLENTPRQFVRLQQMTELQERRRVRHRIDSQSDAREGAQRLAVIERVLARLVGQCIPLLEKVNAQHPLDADRWPAPFAPRVMRLDHRAQPRPRHHLFHLMPPSGGPLWAALRAVYLAPLGSHRNRSRRVTFFFPAYSDCEKLIWCCMHPNIRVSSILRAGLW